MSAWYNEFDAHDAHAADWLRGLARKDYILKGEVDERDIRTIAPREIRGVQSHFFAGVGGWPLALSLAGWPDDREVWTGSCPCQPFSVAAPGRRGFKDERHVWPTWHKLIRARRPATVFGEQVASKDGKVWLARVRADMEALGYDFGAADLCAAGVGAPHIRQRLYWVADLPRHGRKRGQEAAAEAGRRVAQDGGAPRGLRDAQRVGLAGQLRRRAGVVASLRRAADRTWNEEGFIVGLDGKTRRIEPGTSPLADGFPGRVGLLRGWGNAISPQLAAQFVGAFLDTEEVVE